MDGVDVESAITRDRIRAALSRYENKPGDSFENGTVRTVNSDGSYEVLLDGDVQARTCSAYATAGVGDRVLVCIMANGRCVAVARLGGGARPGRNLLLASADPWIKFGWSSSDGVDVKSRESMLGVNGVTIAITKTSTGWHYASYGFGRMDLVKPSTYYTVSFDVYASTEFPLRARLMNESATNYASGWSDSVLIPAGAWKHVALTFKTTDSFTVSSQVVYLFGLNHVGTFKFCNFKLEEGPVDTGWTPAPEEEIALVAEGTSGGWTYRKWANGYAECTADKTINGTWATWGNGYWLNSYMNFPFAFAEAPYVSFSAVGGGGSRTSWVPMQSNPSGTTYCEPSLFRPSAGADSEDYLVRVLAVGRWK